jgi:hypothetical protein
LAEQEKDCLARATFQARARYWYNVALPGLAGMERARVEARLEEFLASDNADPETENKAARGNVRSGDQERNSPRVAPLSLSGVQQEAVLQLRPATRPHRLTGKFIVPQGKRLEIEAGTIIECESGSELSISGDIVVRGTADKHMVLRDRRGIVGDWRGIFLDHTDTPKIEYADIRGAEAGITTVKSRCTLRGCILSHNRVGIKITACGSASHAVLEDCVVAFNESDGIYLLGSSMEIHACTITYNGGWGIQGIYYASPGIHQSIVTFNKGGIYCKEYECKLIAEGSVLAGNATIDIKNESSMEWDLRGNFWGKALTQVLRTQGPAANLPNIAGRVRLDGFLDSVPKQCGASVRMLDKRKLW